ncbi:flagellar basal body rod protein FlgB [Aquincola sp. S2]|uniref:Flagellar basal body rod protein FlgB n=1 Tax=Pseudaquabacterium terrae TaxID=2732868 RepID=A0ABX2EP41_9BURK|nr:flagellar basal body rod protein FlgB [Aquabacterium terrae]NRF70327.1 flagellar basal body rod protein FlgB [Aquabacterium terrae]
MQRLTSTLDFHAQALTLRAERQRLIAGNIANADTPGFVARDMDFAKALREATGGTQAVPGQMAVTSAGHMDVSAGARSDNELLYATGPQDSLDRNTVDLDRERAAFAENAVKYEATLRFINGHMRTLTEAMKNHNGG